MMGDTSAGVGRNGACRSANGMDHRSSSSVMAWGTGGVTGPSCSRGSK